MITAEMEALEECLFVDKVPASWEKHAYPSLLPLAAWYRDLLKRLRELESWVSEFQVSESKETNLSKLKIVNNFNRTWFSFHRRFIWVDFLTRNHF